MTLVGHDYTPLLNMTNEYFSKVNCYLWETVSNYLILAKTTILYARFFTLETCLFGFSGVERDAILRKMVILQTTKPAIRRKADCNDWYSLRQGKISSCEKNTLHLPTASFELTWMNCLAISRGPSWDPHCHVVYGEINLFNISYQLSLDQVLLFNSKEEKSPPEVTHRFSFSLGKNIDSIFYDQTSYIIAEIFKFPLPLLQL